MKKIQVILIVVAMIFASETHADQYDMNPVNQKIQNVIDADLHSINTAIDVKTLIESQEFLALKQKCLTDWQQIAGDIELVGNGDVGKQLVFLAMSYLPATDYITFLESIVEKYSNDVVSEVALKGLLFNDGQMGAFVVDNFNHSRIVEILNAIKNKTVDDAFKQRIDGILDGSAKASLDEFRDGHEGLPEGAIPEVILGN